MQVDNVDMVDKVNKGFILCLLYQPCQLLNIPFMKKITSYTEHKIF